MKIAHLRRMSRGQLSAVAIAASCLFLLLAAAFAAAAYLPYDTIAGRLSCLQFGVSYGGPLHSCGL